MNADYLYEAEYETFMLFSHLEELAAGEDLSYSERLTLMMIATRLREIDGLLRKVQPPTLKAL